MSSRNNNQINIPEAREAMDQFKMEAVSEACSINGQMVMNMCPIRTANYIRSDRTAAGHETEIHYTASSLI